MEIGQDTPAIVSGGASGLGAAVVHMLMSLGVRVGVIDMNIDGLPEGVAGVRADVSNAGDIGRALQSLRDKIGQERICINCAGIAPAEKTVSRGVAHSADLFSKVVGVNLIGTFNLASQSALGMSQLEPVSPDQGRGIIINTASIAAYEGQIGQIAYASSKAGVAGLTLPMSRDLAKLGIRVMAIAPGIFETPMVTGMPQEIQDSLAAISEFPKRLGKPDDFANLVEMIIRQPMLNGEVIRLDAGARMSAR